MPRHHKTRSEPAVPASAVAAHSAPPAPTADHANDRLQSLMSQGDQAAARGDWSTAERAFRTCVAERPDFAAGYLALATVLKQLGKPAEAQYLFGLAAQINPAAAHAYHLALDPVGRAPRVSVILLSYNYAHLLPEALSSVLIQTAQDFEIIIVNDGSTDNTAAVAENLRRANPQFAITVVNQENTGHPAHGRNNGIAIARGQYILPLDADDMIRPNMLEVSVAALDAKPEMAVAYGDYWVLADGKASIVRSPEFDLARLAEGNFVPTCSLFRRSAWVQAGGYSADMYGFEDWSYWLTLAKQGLGFVHVPEPLFVYRRHPTNVTHLHAGRNTSILRAGVALSQPELYDDLTLAWATQHLAQEQADSQAGKSDLVLIPGRFMGRRKPAAPAAPPQGRVGFLVHEVPPAASGTGRYTFDLALALQAQGYTVSVFAPARPPLPAAAETNDVYEEIVGGVPVRRVVVRASGLFGQLHDERVAGLFRDWLTENKIEVLHVQHTDGLPFSLPLEAAALGVPYIVTLHDAFFHCEFYHRLKPFAPRGPVCDGHVSVAECADCVARGRYLLNAPVTSSNYVRQRRELAQQVLRHAARILPVAEVTRANFETELGWAGRYETVPIANEVRQAHPWRLRQRTGLTFGYLGGLHAIKGADILLEAFAAVADRSALELYGSGSGTDYDLLIQSLVEKLPSAQYRGLYNADMQAFVLGRMDVLVMPSRSENSPTVIREAQAAQVPVIAARVGDVEQVIQHGVNGLLFEPGNVADLAAQMRRLAESPELIDQFRRNLGQPRSFEAHVERMAGVYQAVLRGASLPAGQRSTAPAAMATTPGSVFELELVPAPSPDPTERIVDDLLSSQNLVETLRLNQAQLDANVVTLLRRRADQARAGGETAGATALDQLAGYVQQLVAASAQPTPDRARETLGLLLDADDVAAALEQYADRLDHSLLELVRLNEQTARADGELELAGGLLDLADTVAARLGAAAQAA